MKREDLKVGVKVKREAGDDHWYMRIDYIGETHVLGTTHNGYEISCSIKGILNYFTPYEEPVKMVKWYRPKIVSLENCSTLRSLTDFYTHKAHFFIYYPGAKVLNNDWEVIEAPENREEW